MRLEVYEREADAIEAAAEEMAGRIRAAGDGAVVMLPGGRRGRALRLALAEQAEIPWASTRWFVTDEHCGADAPVESNRALVVGDLLAPNRVPAAAVCAPDPALGPGEAAAAWARAIHEACAGRGGPDLIALAVDDGGRIAALDAGAPADDDVIVAAGGRVSIGGALLRAARSILVVATGRTVEASLRSALLEPPDLVARPLQRVLPDDRRVRWYADRAAVAGLLEAARPADA